jgi:hypothetical protein
VGMDFTGAMQAFFFFFFFFFLCPADPPLLFPRPLDEFLFPEMMLKKLSWVGTGFLAML